MPRSRISLWFGSLLLSFIWVGAWIAPPCYNRRCVARGARIGRSTLLLAKKNRKGPKSSGDIEELISGESFTFNNLTRAPLRSEGEEEGTVLFPELEQTGIDEKKLRESPFGKVLFGVLDTLFPVFKEPNWFDVYDPPLTKEENMELPYFDGYDFVNSTWTIYIRHRYGPFNWLDRMGFIPRTVNRVFLRGDGKTMWNDGFYGEWYINPAINYFQLEKVERLVWLIQTISVSWMFLLNSLSQ